MRKILFVHPQFRIIGGAELVALHMLQWFLQCAQTHVTLLTLIPPDIDEVFRSTGIRIVADNLKIQTISLPFHLERVQGRFALIQISFLHRQARKMSEQFDVCLSSFNELDFGRRAGGIQYIHFPILAERSKLQEYKMLGDKNIRDKIPLLNNLYRGAMKLMGSEGKGFTNNITIVNSKFIRDLVRSLYSIDSVVLYPGFLPDEETRDLPPWEQREFSFISVGRISPDKDTLQLLR
ncbi:MAG: hypothetical protein ACRDGA_14425, partial [Bacteroidota bacterium]